MQFKCVNISGFDYEMEELRMEEINIYCDESCMYGELDIIGQHTVDVVTKAKLERTKHGSTAIKSRLRKELDYE